MSGKAKAKVHRVTNAERERQIAAHPETDTRPRYGDGTLAKPEDVVLHHGQTGRVQWFNRTQEVPTVAYDAVITPLGTAPLSECRLQWRKGTG
jgi:hypothetical protein